jgi:Bifunctional DNA primase/polymerase, N-terminal
METGASNGVLALEIDPNVARHALAHLVGNNLSWPRTLRFDADGRCHVLFQYARGLQSLRGYPGVRLHSGSSILVPPSRTRFGIELAYADPHSLLLSADWLRNIN